MDIESHIQQVEDRLKSLDCDARRRFASWCCYALVAEPAVQKHLTLLTGSAENYRVCERIVAQCWYGSPPINAKTAQEILHRIDWDDEDTPLTDEPVTQGCLEMLTAISSMLGGLRAGRKDTAYFANCAENVINWKDTLACFPASADGTPEQQDLLQEYERQRLFLRELGEGRIGAEDIHKFR